MRHPSIARKIAAASTYSSWKKIPHVSFILDLDLTALHGHYLAQAESASARQGRISLNTMIVKLVADALEPYQVLYASFRYSKHLHRATYELCDSVDLNIPWVLPTGEMIPFLFKDVARKSLGDLGREIEGVKSKVETLDIEGEMLGAAMADTARKLRHLRLSALTRLIPLALAKARHGHSSPREADAPLIDPRGVIVSNVGSLLGDCQGRFGLLEIIEPKILAIGIGSLEDRIVPAGQGEGFATRKILPVTLAFDHRAIDFGDLAPFAQRLCEKARDYQAPA